MMNRIVHFVRSLLPTDPTQLVLIFGLVCLTILPRLRWLPVDLASFADDLAHAGGRSYGDIPSDWLYFQSFAFFTFIFAASAGFFACIWPGKRPARRILLTVTLPALLGLGAICARYIILLTPPRSVLQRGFTIGHGPAWVASKLWMLGSGLRFCLAGLVLVTVFVLLVVLRKVSLPISVSRRRAGAVEESKAWKGCKRSIWIFQGAPILYSLPFSLISLLVFLLPGGRLSAWQYNISRGLTTTGEGAVMLGIAAWAMGKENLSFIRKQIGLLSWRHALLALVIPAGPALLPALAVYLFDRADWAAHSFGKLDPPRISDYFGAPEGWMLALLLAAFAEEVIFRGVLQKHFIERFGTWRGICFVGVVWGAFHFFGDSYFQLNDLEIVLKVFSRLIFCLILGFVLSWLTLRSKSLIPATLAHGLNNVFAYSKTEVSFPGQYWVQLGLLALLAYVLFRYWPVETTPEEQLSPADIVPEPVV